MSEKRVIIALSGGVDSSVSAYLLLQQGYHVEALFMKNWDEDDGTKECTAAQDVKDAQSVCDQLGIPLHRVNFAAEYWDDVFMQFLDSLKRGLTPNPDIWCNQHIKFKAFVHHAEKLGAQYIATGHYAGISHQNDQYLLTCAADHDKDQTYFLYTLTQEQLSKTIFPLQNIRKPAVRAIAKEQGFITSHKKDSTGICFIGERNFNQFLNRYLSAAPGPIEDEHGMNLGAHDGLMFFTIGQRKGIKIGGKHGRDEAPWYVIDKNIERNALIVAQGENHPKLWKTQLSCESLHWIAGSPPPLPYRCTAKIRYRQTAQPCKIALSQDNILHIEFESAQRAVTPGQSIVFYKDQYCLGGGIIR